MKTTKRHGIFIMLLATLFLFTNCSEELDDLNGASIIEQQNIAGKYIVQITPMLMGMAPMTTGEHEAELIHEGNGVLRLKFSGFREKPMPFEMSVDIRMKAKPGSEGGMLIENIGGDFDADLPKGVDVINPDDAPDGIQIPEEALKSGLHSKGASEITGKYRKMTINGKEAMNFDWKLNPNVGLPVVVAIQTKRKIK